MRADLATCNVHSAWHTGGAHIISVYSTSVSGKYHAPPTVFYLTHSTCYINKFTLVDLYYYTFFTLQFSVIFSLFTCNQPLTSRCLPIVSTKKPTVYENYVLLFEECLYSPGQPHRGIPWTPWVHQTLLILKQAHLLAFTNYQQLQSLTQ